MWWYNIQQSKKLEVPATEHSYEVGTSLDIYRTDRYHFPLP